VLEGSVQRGDDKIRVVMRLLDTRGGETVWQHRFLRPIADLLSLQDEIAGQTAARIDPALLMCGVQRGSVLPGANPTAYPLLLRAIPAIYRLDRDEFIDAGKLLEEAVAREPSYAPAHAWLAHWHMLSLGQGWTDDRAATLRRMRAHADRALSLDPGDARSLTIVGHVRAFTRHGLAEALALHERALTINPNLPLAWVLAGLAQIYAGNHEEGIRRVERGRALSPLDPAEFWFDTAVALAHLLRHEHDAAITIARRAADMNPYFSSTFKILAASLGHAGWSTVEALAPLGRLEPAFTVTDAMDRSPLAREEDREWFAEGLRRAGVPA
jgi:tetratricopeptide (TPR) repeat protein